MKVQSDVLNKVLQNDENILWSGRPKVTKIFNFMDWFLVPVGILWIFVGIYGLTFLIDTTNYSVTFSSKDLFMQVMQIIATIISSIFSVLGIYFLVFRFIVKAYIRSRIIYSITNRRILIFHNGLLKKIKAIDINKITEIEMSSDKKGTGTIYFFKTNAFIKKISVFMLEIPWIYRYSKRNIFFDIVNAENVKVIIINLINERGKQVRRSTEKELIIDCLADDYEDDIRIQRLLALSGEEFSIERIRNILNEMHNDGLVFINWSISNKDDGYWYGMTEKGIEFWKRIPDDERMTDFVE